MKTPEEKYFNDAHYHALVDAIFACIVSGNFTPSEVREAAIYACVRYEERKINAIYLEKPPR